MFTKTWRRVLTLAIATCLAVGLAPAFRADAAFTPPTYQQTIGHPGHAGVYAWGAATASNGDIIIGDYWNYVMRRYSPSGQLLQTFSSKGTGPGQNMAPHGVDVSPVDGKIYMADMNHTWQILVWDKNGNPVQQIPTYKFGVTVPYPYVTRVAIGATGDIYYLSSHNVPPTFSHRVVVLNPDGSFKRSWGTNGTAPGQLDLSRGFEVAGPSDRVYIADAIKKVIQVFTPEGQYLFSFGQGRFTGDLRGIRVDEARGFVYVVDAAASQIEKFALDGTWLKTFGSQGTGLGQFRDGGRELAVGTDGRVYAPDFGNNRVNVFTSEGVAESFFPNPATPPANDGFNRFQGVAASPTGEAVYTADTYNHRVQKFTSTGDFVTKWGFRSTTGPNAMNYPRGVAVDPADKNVFVVNSREGNVKVYNANGGFIREWGTWGNQPGQFNLARSIAIRGNVAYVADGNNRRIQALNKVTGAPIWSAPCGVSAPQGSINLLTGCGAITTDAAGNVYASGVQDHIVYKFSSAGALIKTWGGLGSSNGQLRQPYGLAVYNNQLYVSESNNNRISVFTLDGGFVGKFGSRGDGDGQFETPRSISIDNSGRLYVVDEKNERVVVFKI